GIRQVPLARAVLVQARPARAFVAVGERRGVDHAVHAPVRVGGHDLHRVAVVQRIPVSDYLVCYAAHEGTSTSLPLLAPRATASASCMCATRAVNISPA